MFFINCGYNYLKRERCANKLSYAQMHVAMTWSFLSRSKHNRENDACERNVDCRSVLLDLDMQRKPCAHRKVVGCKSS